MVNGQKYWIKVKLTHYQTTKFRPFETESLQTTISNSTKLEESYPKQVENTVGKGEIARYEQFLLFPHCFQKACFPGASKSVIVWEWVYDRATENIKPSQTAPMCMLVFLFTLRDMNA